MELKEFLNSPEKPYPKALSLYHRVKREKSKDAFFNSVKDSKPGDLHHNLIIKELSNIYRIYASSPPSPKADPAKPDVKQAPVNKPRIVANPYIEISSLPKDLQMLYERNQEITRQLSGLHQMLKEATTNAQRKTLAEQIDSLHIERSLNWKKIDAHTAQDQDPHAHDADKGAGQEKTPGKKTK